MISSDSSHPYVPNGHPRDIREMIFEYEEPEAPYVAIPPHLKRLRKLIA